MPILSSSTDNGRPILNAGIMALGLGVVASILIGITADGGPYWSAGMQLSLFMLAAFAISGLVGLVFAIPRARTESAGSAVPGSNNTDERYSANSNLEQISDWLTKILVGAGLVQLTAVPRGLRSMGHYLGDSLGVANAEPIAATLVVYGLGCGFLFVYLWARLRLRVLLESSEKQAAEQSQRERVEASLTQAAIGSDVRESASSISNAASAATRSALQQSTVKRKPVLWVDDRPTNNESIAEALRTLGIEVHLVLTTAEAMRSLESNAFGAIITDLGRDEGQGYAPEAGFDLIRSVRQRDTATPIFVYASQRGIIRRDELVSAGATFVTNRPTEIFSRTVEAIIGSSPSA